MILKHITTTTTIPIMHRAQTEHCRACFIPVSYLLGQLFEVGLGPSGLIQKQAHPCRTFFIEMLFKRVDACCTDRFLLKFVPPIDDTLGKEMPS